MGEWWPFSSLLSSRWLTDATVLSQIHTHPTQSCKWRPLEGGLASVSDKHTIKVSCPPWIFTRTLASSACSLSPSQWSALLPLRRSESSTRSGQGRPGSKRLCRFGIFRLTDPGGLQTILECNAKEAFHPHPDVPIYTVSDFCLCGFLACPLSVARSCRIVTTAMCK